MKFVFEIGFKKKVKLKVELHEVRPNISIVEDTVNIYNLALTDFEGSGWGPMRRGEVGEGHQTREAGQGERFMVPLLTSHWSQSRPVTPGLQ